MMASSSELSLDCKPQSYSMLLKSFGDSQITEPQNQTRKLEEFLSRLEEERLKIDAFKRELPLCMTLLTNAMEASRQQLQSYHSNQTSRPVLEEFIPLKNSDCSDQKTVNLSDKANWMTSAQLWSQTSEENKHVALSSANETEIGLHVSSMLSLDSKKKNNGALLPFPKEPGLESNSVSPDLALSNCIDKEIEDNKGSETDGKPNLEHGHVGYNNSETQMIVATHSNNNNNVNTTQAHRKARRCWSPDLHRRFVNALQMLGGSQATPKQIRELMKVDGLTNDEVKSHLQKYRLHTRRPSTSPQSTSGQPPQLVVLGGIWVPPEYAAAHGGAPPPPHYFAPPEYYHHHQQQQQLQLHMFKPSPAAIVHELPESEVRGGKSDASECGSARKGVAEESNESEITLKF